MPIAGGNGALRWMLIWLLFSNSALRMGLWKPPSRPVFCDFHTLDSLHLEDWLLPCHLKKHTPYRSWQRRTGERCSGKGWKSQRESRTPVRRWVVPPFLAAGTEPPIIHRGDRKDAGSEQRTLVLLCGKAGWLLLRGSEFQGLCAEALAGLLASALRVLHESTCSPLFLLLVVLGSQPRKGRSPSALPSPMAG